MFTLLYYYYFYYYYYYYYYYYHYHHHYYYFSFCRRSLYFIIFQTVSLLMIRYDIQFLLKHGMAMCFYRFFLSICSLICQWTDISNNFWLLLNKPMVFVLKVYSLLHTDKSQEGQNSCLWLQILACSELLFILIHWLVSIHIVYQPFINQFFITVCTV